MSTTSPVVVQTSVPVRGSMGTSLGLVRTSTPPATTEKATLSVPVVTEASSTKQTTQTSGKAFSTANAGRGLAVAGMGGVFGVLAAVFAVL